MKPKQIRKAGIDPAGRANPKIKMIVYGDNRTGKTVFAGTSPKCLILNVDTNGDYSAAVQGSTAEVWDIEDYNDFTEAFEYLRHEKHGYEWVWLDSISMLQERGLAQIMADLVVKKPHRSIFLPDKGEYGENMNKISLFMRQFFALPMNVGLTAHEMRYEDPNSDEVKLWPQITGKGMAPKICSHASIIGRLVNERQNDDSVRRILLLQGDGNFVAGDRFDTTPKGRMLSPSVPKIEKAVKEKLAASRNPVPGATVTKAATATKKRISA